MKKALTKRSGKYLLAVLACILLVWACKTAAPRPGGYGSLQGDSAVAQNFLTGYINPDLRYYYLGSEAAPYVIIGVKREFNLDNSRDWRTLGIQAPGSFGTLIKMTYDAWRQRGYTLQGFRIMDQSGRYVGDWFSIWDVGIIHPVVYSKDEQNVVIYPPPFPRLEPSPAGGFEQVK